jgi:predicted ATP-grasp superfamily ATP-dependent carboligase
MGRVFITDAGLRNTVSAIRSLGKRGMDIICGEDNLLAMGFFSKYCHRRVVYPSAKNSPGKWVEFMLTELSRDKYDMLLPMDDDTVMLVAKNKEVFSKYTRIPVPDYNRLMRARSKAKTYEYAIRNDIPCPRTYFVHSLDDVKRFVSKIEFPVVIKPEQSSGARGIVYVENKNMLYDEYLKVHQKYEFPMIQEYIPPGGVTYGIFALLNYDSQALAIFAHRRLREFPLSGGPSTLRESVWRPDLVDLGFRLLKAMEWYGVAMVEFKEDPRDGIPKLMEVNPRFWGSLELSILSGVDFPYLLYRMVVDGEVNPVTTYRVGVRCRWLVGDILHFLANPERFTMNPSFFKFFDKKMGYDILSITDPGPAVGLFLSSGRDLFNGKRWKYVLRRN